MKKIVFTSLIIIGSVLNGKSQGGAKWGTNGNSTSAGDIFGTTNAQPIDFRTNGIQRMVLSNSGGLKINGLAGAGSRLLQSDADGNISAFPMGGSGQVLFGNGVWGNLPPAPNVYWTSSGSSIYYNGGKVGIGTTSPFTELDVVGDARISNNLYVGGGIIITDKVNANSQVKTASVVADSIIMDSTKAVYGQTKFVNDVKLQSRLNVFGNTELNGDATINGNFKTMGDLVFAGNQRIRYTPAGSGHPAAFDFGGPGPIYPDACFVAGFTSTYQFPGIIQATGYNAFSGDPNALSIGYDGQNGTIDLAGTGGPVAPRLLINYYCGKDLYVCTGSQGGRVAMCNESTDSRVGIGSDSPAEKLQVDFGNVLIRGVDNFSSAGNEGIIFLGDQNSYVKSINGVGLKLGVSGVTDGIFLQQSTGNVGIGTPLTNNPNNYKLAVNGLIGSKELKIEITSTTWPDYVFAKDYRLVSLTDLESFIKANKHLPNIPSSLEVKENGGIEVGEMQAKLVQKIEELTLYIIEQDKRIKELENSNKKNK